MSDPGHRSFLRRAFITRDDLIGARWWHEGMEHGAFTDPTRREAARAMLVVGSTVIGGAWLASALSRTSSRVITMDALDLQRREGWDVGSDGRQLVMTGRATADVDGDMGWWSHVETLGRDLAPREARLFPFAVTTLFDSVASPEARTLRAELAPVHTANMDFAFQAGEALAALFPGDAAADAALVVDVPGPSAVAVAAAVGRVFEPVFLFDNWPHPLGVVPSHQTLGAALYLRPALLRVRGERPDTAPPAFILDSDRLAPYRDQSDRFDNRYMARLPSAAALAGLGVRHVLYVTDVPMPHEQDDLNDDFVALARAGTDVKMIALSEFRPMPGSPAAPLVYGGHPSGGVWFWRSYGWRAPAIYDVAPARALPPPSVGATFRPAPRPTIFSSRTVGAMAGVGKQRPTGFGRVSFRPSGGGSSFGRSGSFGRSRSSSFG